MIRPDTTQTRAEWFDKCWGRPADFFLRPPTLTTGNFTAIWPKDFKFSAIKDLNRFKIVVNAQETSSILKVGLSCLSDLIHIGFIY